MKHAGGNVISGAVGAIHHYLQPAQIEIVGIGALAELDVATSGVIDAAGLAEPGRLHAVHRLLEPRLDVEFHCIGQLGALCRKKLDAIVVVGIVRGGDHHAGLQAQGAREIGHGRRRHRPAQHHVDPGRGKSGLQRGFQHIAGNARVLADQHGRMLVDGQPLARHQRGTGSKAQAHHEIRRYRRLTDTTANAVGAEIFASHSVILHSLHNHQRVARRGYVMHAHNARPMQNRQHMRRHPAKNSIRRRAPGDQAEHRLA